MGRILFSFLRSKVFLALLVLVLIAAAFWGGRVSVYKAHPELTDGENAAAIVKKVGALIDLPSDETPTVATIKDAAAAKQGQPFLDRAENGDTLIVYTNAHMALLYRSVTNKIIAVGPVNQTTPETSQPVSASPKPVATTTPEKKR